MSFWGALHKSPAVVQRSVSPILHDTDTDLRTPRESTRQPPSCQNTAVPYPGSLRESDSQSLPSAVAMMLDQPPAEARATCERRRKVTPEKSSRRLSPACLLALAMAGVLWAVNSNSRNDWVFERSGTPRPEQAHFQPDADGLLQLARLELSHKCVLRIHRGQRDATTLASEPAQHFVCCTQCHSSASSSQPSSPHAISVAMAACTACHE